MGCYRAELIQRLDYILRELDRRSGRLDVDHEDYRFWYCEVRKDSVAIQYGELKGMLQEVDQEATEILNHTCLTTLSFSVC